MYQEKKKPVNENRRPVLVCFLMCDKYADQNWLGGGERVCVAHKLQSINAKQKPEGKNYYRDHEERNDIDWYAPSGLLRDLSYVTQACLPRTRTISSRLGPWTLASLKWLLWLPLQALPATMSLISWFCPCSSKQGEQENHNWWCYGSRWGRTREDSLVLEFYLSKRTFKTEGAHFPWVKGQQIYKQSSHINSKALQEYLWPPGWW